MKKVLGIDLGVSSIGWAMVNTGKKEASKIIDCGVRIIPMGNEAGDFEKGKSISLNAERREKRSARRNLQRYKLRRKRLKALLVENRMSPTVELIKLDAEELLRLRASATQRKLSLAEIGRVLILLNKKRGYKSNRKANDGEMGLSPLESKRQLIKTTLGKKNWKYADELSEANLLENSESTILKQIAQKDPKFHVEELLETLEKNKIKEEHSYLGQINKRKHLLQAQGITIGEYLFNQYLDNPTAPLKGQIFYRNDYWDEFNRIWEQQKTYYPNILTDQLKKEIGDYTIFYQRPLKSQKGRVSNCRFHNYLKAIPKSSPVFQEFKIWQSINNLEIKDDDLKIIDISLDQKQLLFSALNNSKKQSQTAISKILKFPSSRAYHFNFPEGIQGNTTLCKIKNKLDEVGYDFIQNTNSNGSFIKKKLKEYNQKELNVLELDTSKEIETQPVYHLWHLLYSIDNPSHLIPKLIDHFGMSQAQAAQVGQISFPTDHGTLSSKAIKEILPHLKKGHNYYDACELAGHKHSDYLTKEENDVRELEEQLSLVKKGSLRNPVVEKILNHLVNLINSILDTYGRPDEIRIELARQLKQNAKQRENRFQNITKRAREHEVIKKTLEETFGFRNPSRKTIEKYKLWQEFNRISIYSGEPITHTDLFSAKIDVEHIIPKSRYFDDSFANKVLCERSLNEEKGARTAYDFMKSKSPEKFNQYVSIIKDNKGLSFNKRKYLLMEGTNIPDDFIDRQKRDSQFIAKAAIDLLTPICRRVTSTTGGVTNFLLSDWGLNDLLLELNREKYKASGILKEEQFTTSQGKDRNRVILEGKKFRDDQRHHALDAIIIAFTNQSIIQRLNNLNKNYNTHKELKTFETRKDRFPQPLTDFRNQVKDALSTVLVSYRGKRKVVTQNTNKYKVKGGEKRKSTMTPRGMLHKETVYGKIKIRGEKPVKLGTRFTKKLAELIVNPQYKNIVLERLKQFSDNPKLAFKGLKKNPILDPKGKEINDVLLWEEKYVVKKTIGPDFKQVDKVVDKKIKSILKDRLEAFDNKPKLAFSNLEEHPIWLNQEKNIKIKRVRIMEGFEELVPLHVNEKGIPIDYVNLRNNHHAAFYETEKGDLIEDIVSFMTVLHRKLDGQPVYQDYDTEGNKLKLILHINDMVLIKPEAMEHSDLENLWIEKNHEKLSKLLYRVQKLSSKYYVFRHHLASNIDDDNEMVSIRSANGAKTIRKVRLNRLGIIEQFVNV